jgi:hypothetical protein
MNKRFLIISTGAVAILVLLITSFYANQKFGTGSLDLTIQPADATVTVDDKPADPTAIIKLKPGNHTVAIKRDGFVAQKFSVTITADKTTSRTVTLKVFDSIGSAYINNHPEFTTQAEGEAGKAVEEQGAKITQNNPLIQLLPYRGSTFSLNIGVSQAHPEDTEAVGIYVTAPTDADKAKALGWIKAQGYNPAAYEIIYQ